MKTLTQISLSVLFVICGIFGFAHYGPMLTSADSGSPTGIALPPPAIPHVAPLPGPIADAASPSPNMTILKVSPIRGTSGSPVTISASGLRAGADFQLTWSTANLTWVADPQPSSVNYLGRQSTPVTVVIKSATTDNNGNFSVQLKAPYDWGGLHDIYAVINHVQVAHGGFLIDRYMSYSPKSGPIGTPIHIIYHGMGSSLYESGASLLYDNHFVGELTANWTRGTARVTIRAAGPVGMHTLQVGDAVGPLYMNIPQSPLPWAKGFAFRFRVTADNGPPKPRLEWPANVQPTVSERTTLQGVGQVTNSGVKMNIGAKRGAVASRQTVSASGVTAHQHVQIVWATVVGNRVNCKGVCWQFVTQTLRTVTPNMSTMKTRVNIPQGLGGWHVMQLIQNGQTVAQTPFFVQESLVGKTVSSITVKQGHHFTIHLHGIGWTQVDNIRAVDYDNSYVGYGCGFNSNGNVVFDMEATGAPGTHLIDMYPVYYTLSPSFANTPFGMIPILSSSRDFAGLALGYRLPIGRFAIRVVK